MENLTFELFISGGATLGQWLLLLSGLFTPAIAIIGAIIAKNQLKLSRNKLKHDLFERRMVIFSTFITAMNKAANGNSFTDQDLADFRWGTYFADYFFDKGIIELIETYRHKFVELNTSYMLNQNTQTADVTESINKTKSYFYQQLAFIKTYFENYLKIE